MGIVRSQGIGISKKNSVRWAAVFVFFALMSPRSQAQESTSMPIPHRAKAIEVPVLQNPEPTYRFSDPGTVNYHVSPSVAGASLTFDSNHRDLALGISQESYLTRSTPNSSGQGFQLLSTRLRTFSSSEHFYSNLDLQGGFATNAEDYNFIVVPEAYLRWSTEATQNSGKSGFTNKPKTEGLSLTVGRSLENWSRLDTEWGLGVWQPLYRPDWLRPESQGFSGAFLAMEGEKSRLVLFASPLFVPEQGPKFSVEDGKFSSSSPWFGGPPQTVNLFSQTQDINYNIKTPSVGSVVGHGAAGAMVQLFNPEADGFWMQLSYSYAPRNQLETPFQAQLVNLVPTVSIYPEVDYHHLIGGDLGFRKNNFSSRLSVLNEIPINSVLDSSYVYRTLDPVTFVSPSVTWALPWMPASPSALSASYLYRDGGDTHDVSTIGASGSSAAGSIFGPRFPYKQAVSLGYDLSTHTSYGQRLAFGLKAIQELTEDGSILMADVRFEPLPFWTLLAGADLLASGESATDTSTLIASDRGNDRVFLGAAYAF